jgi:hypothetical protein
MLDALDPRRRLWDDRMRVPPQGARLAGKRSAASKTDEETIRVRRGDRVEFPVPARHPLARFQELVAVRSVTELSHFLVLWEKLAEGRDVPPLDPAAILRRLKRDQVKILHLSTATLRIDSGAVMTLNHPLNQLEFTDIRIAGDLVAHGDVVLKADTLTMA